MINKVMLEKVIGRQLVDFEQKAVEKINHLDSETGFILMSLFYAAKDNGMSEATKSTNPA